MTLIAPLFIVYRDLKRDGCTVECKDDGSTIIRHPCMHPGADTRKLCDRSLLTDEEKRMIIPNYIHNYEQDLLDGVYEGTFVIVQNLSCPHFGELLCEALMEIDIPNAILRFLGQCEGQLTVRLGGGVKDITSGERNKLPHLWMDILTLMLRFDVCPKDTRLVIAKSIGPLVRCMINDEKRQVFQSKNIWYNSLASFFCLVDRLVQTTEGRFTITSYEGLLPFIAQACCWNISRKDIVIAAAWFQLDSSISDACYEAQRVIYYVVQETFIEDAKIGDVDLIASTPVLSNESDCTESVIVGFIRMMIKQDDHILLQCTVENLLLLGYVDARVITELIKCGRQSLSIETSNSVMSMALTILGLDDNTHNQLSDSRYSVAIRSGLLELCVHASRTCDQEILSSLEELAKGLYTVAMHKKTSRALREKRSEILSALDALNKISPPYHERISPLINDSLEFGTSTCCNCMKTFHQKDLLFCAECKVECYCSVSCQSQSWNTGHKGCCKKISEYIDMLRSIGVSKADIKRYTTLENNLMMAGCRFVKNNAEEILNAVKKKQCDILGATVLIDYRQAPAVIYVRNDDHEPCAGTLKFAFTSLVLYGFIPKATGQDYPISLLEKFIPVNILGRH